MGKSVYKDITMPTNMLISPEHTKRLHFSNPLKTGMVMQLALAIKTCAEARGAAFRDKCFRTDGQTFRLPSPARSMHQEWRVS